MLNEHQSQSLKYENQNFHDITVKKLLSTGQGWKKKDQQEK